MPKEMLHKAAYNGDIAEVKKLLSGNPDPDARDSFGGTALHAAMFQNNMEIVLLLLDSGFDPNAIGPKNGYAPLHDAVWGDNLEAIRILLERGADTNVRAKDGLTPYMKAQAEGKTNIVRFFESKGIKK